MSTNNQPMLAQMLDILAQIALKIRKSLNLEEILNTAVITLRQVIQSDRIVIYRFEPDGSAVMVASETKQFICKNTEKFSEIKWVEDYQHLAEEKAEIDTKNGEVVVQILPGENLWGLLIAERRDLEWQKLEVDLIAHLATMLAIAIQQRELELQTGPRTSVYPQKSDSYGSDGGDINVPTSETRYQDQGSSQIPNNTTNLTKDRGQKTKLPESVLRGILEATADGIIVINSEDKIVDFNRKCLMMLSLSKYNIYGWDEKQLLQYLGQKLKDPQAKICTFDKSYIILNRPLYARMALKTGKILDTYSLPYKIGEKYIGRVLTFRDITDRKEAEALQQRTLEQLQAVLDAVPGFVSWIDGDRRYLGVNKHLASCFELYPGDFVGKELGFLRSSPQFVEFMSQFMDCEELAATQVVEATIANSRRHYLIAAQKYQQGNAAVSIGIDITDRQHARDRLEASLREKEMLLKEIHHRVKNNLQVVSSLLDLQAQQISDPHIQGVFRESKNRVKSIALIHEKLYSSINLEQVNLPEYIDSIMHQIFRTYAVDPDKITWQIYIDRVSLNIDTAIPCGLIINELVSNALKYAFPDRRQGTVTIAFTAVNEEFHLQVSNDGVKSPESIDWRSPPNLGLQLVKGLVRQIKGKIEIDRSRGTAFKIIFSPTTNRK